MAVNPVQDSVSAVLARQSTPGVSGVSGTPASSAIATTNTNSTPTQAYSTNVAYTPQALQNIAALQDASDGFAQFGSVLQIAQTGTQQVSALLQRLQDLTNTANSSGTVSNATLGSLDSEFQEVLSQINQSVNKNSFGGANLLSGSSSASQSTSASSGTDALLNTISLPDLSVSGLFGGTTPNIATPEAVSSTLAALGGAQNTVDSATSILSGAQSEVSNAAAGVETALANTIAASSVLTDSDVSGDGSSLIAGLASSPAASVGAQTGNLSGSLLSLLQE